VLAARRREGEDMTTPHAAPPTRLARRTGRRLARFAVGLTAVLVVLLAVSAGANAVLAFREGLTPSYGRLVTIPGGTVNTSVSGSGEETFVIVPGLGGSSPVLEFAPLVDDLDDHATVVVVEPFGYGWSDRRTGADRTVENMTTQLHQTLTALAVHQPYTLVAHSIGGLYALDYVNRFPGEVRALVTIDGQVPLDGPVPEEPPLSRWGRLWTTSGVLRWASAITPALLVQAPPDTYPEAARRQLRTLALRNDSTPAVVEESQREAENIEAVRGLSFPTDLPVLAFVAQDSMDFLPEWYPAHQKQLAGLARSKLVVVDDGHYLHHHHSPEIAEAVRTFLA
jgi:pimeloyl-ACP methyl ester carboxylesterase